MLRKASALLSKFSGASIYFCFPQSTFRVLALPTRPIGKAASPRLPVAPVPAICWIGRKENA
jgi:hypothetical protein